MKRIICLLLLLVLVVGLCACGSSDSGGKKGLQVGFARESITPQYTVCLQGGAYKERISTGMLDMLYITCIAITDGEQTYLLYTMDVKLATGNFAPETRAQVAAATGIPFENIYLNATHTHSGVAIRYNWDNADRYRTDFAKAAVKSAQKAVADIAPAEVSIGTTMTNKMAWVRHYNMADGTVAGSNFGNTSSGYVSHVLDADNELQLIRFTRSPGEDGKEKKDIVLASFPAHATFNEGGTDLSADFPGPFRDYVEKNANVLCAYFIGAAGNQTPSSRIQGEAFSRNYRDYGAELGRYAVEALPTLTKIENTELKATVGSYTGATHKENTSPERVAQAQEVTQTVNAYGAKAPETLAIVAEYGFSSRIEASWVIKRASLEDTRTMELKAFAIGDLSFIFASYEMSGIQGQYIKEHTPYDMTFVVTCSEGDNSYIPTAEAFDYNSYESQCSYWARGTAEILADEFVKVLTQLKGGAE